MESDIPERRKHSLKSIINQMFLTPCFNVLTVKEEHHPEKCLFYEGKWRNVCLACGKVEMEDGWRKL